MMRPRVLIAALAMPLFQFSAPAWSANLGEIYQMARGLLVQTTRRGAARPTSFTRKWTGKFDVRPSDGDPLLDALKDKYGLADK